MEFETNTPDKPVGISDDQRFAASTKRVTIAPLHTITTEEPVIRPREDVPADVQVSQGNVYIASESEDTSTLQADANREASTASVASLPTRPISRTTLFVVIGLFVAVTGTVLALMTIR